ncbi:MAG: phosphate/phosphite/phosphonate ABC transporter substrate-binding protein [Endomicrobiia bacterium]
MAKKLILYFLLLTILSILSCGKKEEIKNINLSEPAEKIETKIPQNAIRVGIAAVLSPKEGFLYYKELLDYIANKISRPIVLTQGRYEEINRMLKSNQIELAFVCSGAYIEVHSESKAELLVVPVVNNKTEYYSYIIVHKESKIKNFADLKGKSFAFTDPLSNSGYLFPVFLVAKKGKTYQSYFSRTIFTYSHDNSIIAVAEKLVDAAAVDSLIYDWLSETNPELISRTKIILTSPPFGIPPIVVSKNVDVKIKDNLRKIFLELDKDQKGRNILAKLKIDKFVIGSDRMYDSIRIMKAKVKKLTE